MKYKSSKYKSKRAAKGRQVGYKDLTFSGRMWNSLTADFFGVNSVKLFFGGREENKKAVGNDKVNEFFGLSSNEDVFIDKHLAKVFKEAKI